MRSSNEIGLAEFLRSSSTKVREDDRKHCANTYINVFARDQRSGNGLPSLRVNLFLIDE